jgi:hypothetical protein
VQAKSASRTCLVGMWQVSFSCTNTKGGLVSSFAEMVQEGLITVTNSFSHLPGMSVNLQVAPSALPLQAVTSSIVSGRQRKIDVPS